MLPSYEDYMRDKGTVWKARCVAYMVGHFAEHVWVYYKHYDKTQLHGQTKTPAYYVSYMARKHCPELQIVWDIALASRQF